MRILPNLSNWSLSRKLVFLIMLSSTICLLVSLTVLFGSSLRSSYKETLQQLSSLSDILAENAQAALIFEDRDEARRLLDALQQHREIDAAWLLDAKGDPLAAWNRHGAVKTAPADYRTDAKQIRSEFWSRNAELYRPVMRGEDRIGYVLLHADLTDNWNSHLADLETGLIVAALSLLAVYFLATRLQNVISRPIRNVADTARTIADNKSYELRVPQHSNDEIGDLTLAFNHMLSEIQDRDESLLRHQDRLEKEVVKRTEELARTNDELALAAKMSTLGYWEYDVLAREFTFNDQYYSLHFTTASEVGGYRLSYEDFAKRFIHHEDTQRISDHIQFELDSSEADFVVETEIRTLCADGSMRWMRIRFKSQSDEHGRKYKLTGVSQDITEKKRSEETIWQQANFDPLTGLPNRRMFQDRLEHEIKKSNREGLPLALMFIDLDKFKEVNDTLGHDKGDILLVEAAQRISGCVRESDTVARLGGDEFTVILSELDDANSIERIAQAIIQALVAPFLLAEEVAFVSASIGITLYPNDAPNLELLMSNADQAMYASKSAGRNRFSYFTPSMQAAALNRMHLINDLRDALSRNQFRLHYHPIVELSSGNIHKAEALIRWDHPVRGLINPAEFVALAEESGMIVEIGDWVFRESVRQVLRLREEHHPEFQISVNKSPIQFRNDDRYFRDWLPHLQQLGLPGECITIEITEGLLLDATESVQAKLLDLRDAGIQVALDDFGTGYSSLSYLKKFDIDYIKIDRSFVRNLTATSDDMVLCEAIIVMAHKLGLKVIAEGIETATQRHLLTAAGCDYGQGHFFSRPLPSHEFESMLKNPIRQA
ncbi:bifunctional diguanylate cyclase/phosphodiesterase [Sideroxydans lithotrophicus]|uniref:Diguanylate cyclase/phosphodiesterase with PAS/PAC sensor(S) n=1 Tax=Sideroxydans lithotrophicus (strain ES-1) TaxID=580332 RepID=D5CQ10_SIDLE|nr:EAL domain-containing protein [Sideroxydans lithotrophicus]ADE11174.1 diguanylate cyclase/phosphodiesterase with PAS/PAC sensor(s) [Sideroxydans lithotrophicus ES-1]